MYKLCWFSVMIDMHLACLERFVATCIPESASGDANFLRALLSRVASAGTLSTEPRSIDSNSVAVPSQPTSPVTVFSNELSAAVMS
jgi:hypothetical protein